MNEELFETENPVNTTTLRQPSNMPSDTATTEDETIIHPQPSDQQELLAWFESVFQRYDDVLRWLADGKPET